MPRQQALLLEPQPSHGWSHLLVALQWSILVRDVLLQWSAICGTGSPGKLHCSLRYRYVDRVEFPTRHDLLEFQNICVFRLLSSDEFILGSLLILGFLSSSGLELCCLQRSCVLFQLQSCVLLNFAAKFLKSSLSSFPSSLLCSCGFSSTSRLSLI